MTLNAGQIETPFQCPNLSKLRGGSSGDQPGPGTLSFLHFQPSDGWNPPQSREPGRHCPKFASGGNANLDKSERVYWREMIQTMLAERFGLEIAHAKRLLPVSLLTAASGGVKLKPAGNCDASESKYPCGKVVGAMLATEVHGRDVTLDDLAAQFSVYALPVVNETGLTGKYDFDFVEPAGARGQSLPPGPASGTRSGDAMQRQREAWLAAFKQQLGLVLNIDMSNPPQREIDVIQVTSVSQPTEN